MAALGACRAASAMTSLAILPTAAAAGPASSTAEPLRLRPAVRSSCGGFPATSTLRHTAEYPLALIPSPAPAAAKARARPLSSPPRSSPSDEATVDKQEGQSETATGAVAAAPADEAGGSSNGSGNGAAREGAAGAASLPLGDPELSPLKGLGKVSAQLKMFFAPPWARVKKGSVLSLRLSGRVSEQLMGFGGGMLTMPKLLENLEKAAVDPRISALSVRIDPLQLGWAKVDEIRRYIALFRKSGKPCVAYLQVVGEAEFYLASAFEEIYVPPTAYVSLRGLAVQGTFLGGVLEKAGVEPQVQRIGKYKSAGDQFARKDMSDANREMLTALLDDIYFNWIGGIAAARGKTVDELQALLDDGIITAEQLLEAGLVSGLKYEDEVEHLLKVRTGVPEKEMDKKPLKKVEYRRYSRVGRGTLGLGGSKDATIAVLRASGAISQGRDRGQGGSVRSDSFIDKIRFVRENKLFKAVVLRIDSPGGDALASDLMWHELRELNKVKPVVASMADVAASGGYYMAMAAPVIVAERLTLTGSIGVVLAKFNLASLYQRVGLTRELISRGKYAEVNADNRPFSPEEEAFFAEGAKKAYKSFRDKAAMSRNMDVEAMEAVAQGRVWTGIQAQQRGLVDALGGISRAIAIAKEKAGIPQDKRARVVELSISTPSVTALLSGASALARLAGLEGPSEQRAALTSLLLPSLGEALGLGADALGTDTGLLGAPAGTAHALMPEIQILGMSSFGRGGAAGGLQFGVEAGVPLLMLKGLLDGSDGKGAQ